MGGLTMQTEGESEEHGQVLTALEQVGKQDNSVGPVLVPLYRVYRDAEQITERQEQSAAVETAITLARKEVELGDLLASPALGSMKAFEDLRRQMTAPLCELPRLMLGEDTLKSMRASFDMGLGISALERAALGVSGTLDAVGVAGIGAWADHSPARLITEDWKRQETETLNALKALYRPVSVASLWQAEFEAIQAAETEWLQQMKYEALAALSFESTVQRAIEALGVNPFPSMADIARDALGLAVLGTDPLPGVVTFEELQPWPGMIPRHWEVYEPEPEPPAEQIEVVQLPIGDWRELIDLVITEGKATTKQVLDYLQERSGRLSRMPNHTELEETYSAYQILKSKGLTAEAIARRLGMSRAKLYRWLKMFETFLKQ